MKSYTMNAPAKLNLALDIVGVRKDGYHLMEMVMQTIDLYDTVTVHETVSNGISISGSFPGVKFNESNIAYRAAEEFFDCVRVKKRGARIEIKKNIPVGAGLGGGSSDAAAVIMLLSEMHNTKMGLAKLISIAEKIGADVPFFLVKGTALVTGIGECVQPIAPIPNCYIVVCKPKVSVATVSAFAAYDRVKIQARPNIAAMQLALEKADLTAVAKAMGNVFEDVIKHDEIENIKEIMRKCDGLKPMITGSGSAVFSIFPDKEKANECKNQLSKVEFQAFVCRSIEAYPLL